MNIITYPLKAGSVDPLTPQDYEAIVSYIEKNGTQVESFDVVFTTHFNAHKDFKKVLTKYSKACVNWFVECLDPWRGTLESFKEIISSKPE